MPSLELLNKDEHGILNPFIAHHIEIKNRPHHEEISGKLQIALLTKPLGKLSGEMLCMYPYEYPNLAILLDSPRCEWR